MKPRLEGQLRRLAVLVFWIIVWALAAAAVGQELLLPGPLQVAHRLAALAGTVDFWLTLGRSILRVLTGIVSAVFLGIGVGLLTHKSILARELISPVTVIMICEPVETAETSTDCANFPTISRSTAPYIA